jgi:hypothetical protein
MLVGFGGGDVMDWCWCRKEEEEEVTRQLFKDDVVWFSNIVISVIQQLKVAQLVRKLWRRGPRSILYHQEGEDKITQERK